MDFRLKISKNATEFLRRTNLTTEINTKWLLDIQLYETIVSLVVMTLSTVRKTELRKFRECCPLQNLSKKHPECPKEHIFWEYIRKSPYVPTMAK